MIINEISGSGGGTSSGGTTRTVTTVSLTTVQDLVTLIANMAVGDEYLCNYMTINGIVMRWLRFCKVKNTTMSKASKESVKTDGTKADPPEEAYYYNGPACGLHDNMKLNNIGGLYGRSDLGITYQAGYDGFITATISPTASIVITPPDESILISYT